GHALEAAAPRGVLRHGEAVAWGIAAALVLSRRRAGLVERDAAVILPPLPRLGPFPGPQRDPSKLPPPLFVDKKAASGGTAGSSREAIGRARVEKSVPAQEWLDAAAIMSLS